MKIVCNSGCKKVFEIVNSNYPYEKRKDGEYTELYYVCPGCGLEYHINWETDESLDLYEKIIKTDNYLEKITLIDKRQKLLKIIELKKGNKSK